MIVSNSESTLPWLFLITLKILKHKLTDLSELGKKVGDAAADDASAADDNLHLRNTQKTSICRKIEYPRAVIFKQLKCDKK
jgi:hypothetical protein